MIITLAGGNSFALQERLNKLAKDFVKEHGELALERIDGEEKELSVITDSINNMPFLTSRKMIIVRNLSANKQAAEQIEQVINAVGDDTELILHEPLTDKRTVYFKTLKSKTQLEEFNELDVYALAKWLAEEAKNREGELSQSHANYLVERVGLGQAMLSNELDKLITYNPKITKDSIDLLTESTPQSKVFELLDAAFSGSKKRALSLYDEQRAQKVEPQAILAMIAWQLQLFAITKYADGKSTASIAKDVGMNPYPISKAASLAHKIDDNKLQEMVSEAFSIDLKSKTTALDLDEALKTYIVTL